MSDQVKTYSFQSQLHLSSDPSLVDALHSIYHNFFPNVIAVNRCDSPSQRSMQRVGVDAIIQTKHQRAVFVDEKILRTAQNHFLCEQWSVYEERVPGWVIDDKKQTDWVAYAIIPRNECWMIPYPELRLAAQHNIEEWIRLDERYPRMAGSRRNSQGGCDYHTMNVAVSWDRLTADIQREIAPRTVAMNLSFDDMSRLTRKN